MEPRDWTVAVIEPNKYEAQIQLDFLRAAGVTKVRWFKEAAEALDALELLKANVIVVEAEAFGADGLDWVKKFRRMHHLADRKAGIFVLARGADRALAEACRLAGANAIIAKPVSAAGLVATIKKVLATPRNWIEGPAYVGPCRRSGIVTRGINSKRRTTDRAALDVAGLTSSVATLAKAAGAAVNGRAIDLPAALGAIKAIEGLARDVGDVDLGVAASAVAAALMGSVTTDAARTILATRMDEVAQGVARAMTDASARAEMAARVKAAERAKAAQNAA